MLRSSLWLGKIMIPIEAAPVAPGLHRTLGIGFGIAVCVGAMVGVGILRSPSLIAGHVPDVFLIAALWVAGGANAMLDANVLAELASTIAPQIAGHITLVALSLQLMFYLINLRGVQQGAWTQNITSLLKMVFLFAIIGAIFFAVPHATAKPAVEAVSLTGAVLSYTLIVSAYSGWNAPAYFAEEKTDPAKQIPRALFVSVALVALLYVTFNLALARALSLPELRSTPLPAAVAMSSMFGSAAGSLVAAVAILRALSCLNGGIMMASRVLFGLARDKLFLPPGTRVNVGGTPYVAMLVTAGFSALIAATGTFETIFLMVGIFTVLVNVLMTTSFFVLRRRESEAHRHYRARGYPVLPLIALVVDSCLLAAFIVTNPRGALFGGGLLVLAVPVWLLLRDRRAIAQ